MSWIRGGNWLQGFAAVGFRRSSRPQHSSGRASLSACNLVGTDYLPDRLAQFGRFCWHAPQWQRALLVSVRGKLCPVVWEVRSEKLRAVRSRILSSPTFMDWVQPGLEACLGHVPSSRGLGLGLGGDRYVETSVEISRQVHMSPPLNGSSGLLGGLCKALPCELLVLAGWSGLLANPISNLARLHIRASCRGSAIGGCTSPESSLVTLAPRTKASRAVCAASSGCRQTTSLHLFAHSRTDQVQTSTVPGKQAQRRKSS